MTPNTIPLLRVLLREGSSETERLLVDFVRDKPGHAAHVRSVLQTSLEDIATQPDPTVPADALLTFTRCYPEEASDLFGSLVRLTDHTNSQVRREAIRCLGYLGGISPTDRELTTDVLIDALNDDSLNVRHAATWGLTKLGVVAPTVMAQHRSELVQRLEFGKNPSRTSREIRRNTVEAMAAIAPDSSAVDALRPATILADDQTKIKAAAWAIQHCALDCAFDPKVEETTDPHADHGLIGPLTQTLEAQAQRKNGDLSVAATIAIGVIASSNDSILTTLVEDHADRRAHAAQWILGHRRPSTKPHVDLDTDAKRWTLQVGSADGEVSGTTVGIPYEINDQYDTDLYSQEVTLALQGDSVSMSSVTQLHPDSNEIKMGRCLRENIGVDAGDTVTIQKHETVPAEAVKLILPYDSPIAIEGQTTDAEEQEDETLESAQRMTHTELRSILSEQRLRRGDFLGINVLVNGPEPADIEDRRCLRRISMSDEYQFDVLPILVVSAEPAEANKITSETTIRISYSDILTTSEWISNDQIKNVTPLVRFPDH